jgi:membrane-associated phospholipid phosphatase
MHKVLLLCVLACAAPTPVAAQEPVVKWADAASWGTALANPTIEVVRALRGSDTRCQLTRLAVSEVVGNVVTLIIKATVDSPRPCLGCKADGMPSGHTMNSVLGATQGWQYGFVLTTGLFRHQANRHTVPQVLAGAAIGVGAQFLGQAVPCGR